MNINFDFFVGLFLSVAVRISTLDFNWFVDVFFLPFFGRLCDLVSSINFYFIIGVKYRIQEKVISQKIHIFRAKLISIYPKIYLLAYNCIYIIENSEQFWMTIFKAPFFCVTLYVKFVDYISYFTRMYIFKTIRYLVCVFNLFVDEPS